MTDEQVTTMADANLTEHVRKYTARYKAFTADCAEFPYTAEIAARISWAMWVEVQEATYATDDTISMLDHETNGGLGRFIDLFGDADPRGHGGRVDRDFLRVINALKRGTKSDMDEAITLDRFSLPNIAPYMAGCRQSVSIPIEETDNIDLDTFIGPWHGNGPTTGPFEGIFGGASAEYRYMADDGTEWAIVPYNLLWPWDKYRVIVNLCAAGYEWAVRTTLAPTQKRPRRTQNVTTRQVIMPNDTITNALFGRESNAIQPFDYFGHDEWQTALTISTGRGGSASIVIVHGANTTIDAAIETYRLSPEDRFWLEAICSLAKDGYEVIRGSDILKFNGYQNPYQKTAHETMYRAYQSCRKMWRMRIAIDTTKENRKRYPNLAESYDEQPLIDCNWRVMRFDDDTLDFEIKLNLTNDGTPLGALPLAVYATDKRQLLLAERTDFEFRTVKRLTLDHRLMWRYVLRRMKDKTTSRTIVFDTIFKNIGLDDMDRFKRSRMLSTLHKMLEERQRDGILTFTWNRDKNGKAEYSVTITPVKEAESR